MEPRFFCWFWKQRVAIRDDFGVFWGGRGGVEEGGGGKRGVNLKCGG